jgi:protein-disulfide isomerase
MGDQLRFVYRNFPLREAHPHAEHAAEAAEWAGDSGKFWEMHDALFEHRRDGPEWLDDAHLLRYARDLGLDPADLERAFMEQRYRPRVRGDFMSGVRSGVNGTTTFFVNGQRYDGSWDLPELLDALEGAGAAG